MDLTVIVPFYNGNQHIGRLLASLPIDLPVLIIDDRSDAPPAVDRPNTRVMRLLDKGYFAGAVNAGFANTSGDVLILNQDTWFSGNSWLSLLKASWADYGLIGEGIGGKHPAWPKGYIHGTFMFVRRDVIRAIGLLDAQRFPLWGGTADYQARACRKGFKALPLVQGSIPEFHHERHGRFGESITDLLAKQPDKRDWLIRTPPLISVVVNCYNHGRYAADMLNSLIGGPTSLGAALGQTGQTFQGFEIVIVDDGSTDGTPAILDALADDWKGIHVIHQPNKGSAAAMNAGIAEARGRYIAPLDADDMMKPGRLERMLGVIEKDPTRVVYDDIAYFAYGGLGITIDRHSDKLVLTMPLPKVYDFERVLYKNSMHKGLLISRKAWEITGGYPEVMDKGREDWAFNVALGIHGFCGVHTGAAEYLYRREGQNRTLTNTTPTMQNFFRAQLEKLYPDIYRGERPTMCCGSRRPTGQRNPGSGGARAMSMRDLPGKGGMVLLEYTGLNAGDETWTNADKGTGRTYVFGGVHKIGYVDAQDAEWMLAIRSNGRNAFRRATPPKPAIPAAPRVAPIAPRQTAPRVVEVETEPLPQVLGERTIYVSPPGQEPRVTITAAASVPAPEKPAPTAVVTDLLGLSVRDLKVMLESNKYPRDVLEATLKQEKRATARKLLEAALA